MTRQQIMVLLIILSALIAAPARGDDIEFSFNVPIMPQPPKLSDISRSTVVSGNDYFTVFARIEGQMQKEPCCGANCDQQDCDITEWWMRDDPEIGPNPPCIPNPAGHPVADSNYGMTDHAYAAHCTKNGNPLLFYYFNGDVTAQESVAMSYDPDIDKFKGDIPITGLVAGDQIAYYIVASDSRGNVISQLPASDTAPCSSVSSWNSNYETSPISNCSMMISYDRCSNNYIGSPACGTNYTINDPESDTCGEPDANGNQTPAPGLDHVDILGISAGAGKGFADLPGERVVCAKVGLGAPPQYSSSGPVDAYLMIFFNPDINDPNPADVYFPNAFAISYSPAMSDVDPSLEKVLWDGECVTNPNTPDPLACKIFVGADSENRLKVNYTNGNLIYIVKNGLDSYRSILGTTSGSTRIIHLTAQIQLSGGTPFWLVDVTTGMTVINQNKTVGPPPEYDIELLFPSEFRKVKMQSCAYYGYTCGSCGSDTECYNEHCCTGAFRKAWSGAPDVAIEMYDATDPTAGLNGDGVIKSVQTNADGSAPEFKFRAGVCDSCADPAHTYQVRARLPAGTWDPIYATDPDSGCPEAKAGEDCIVTLTQKSHLYYGMLLTVNALDDVPDFDSGLFGGDAGNPNCDGVVDMSDLTPFKDHFGCLRGDDCYNAAADFDMDGAIGIKDLNLLKSNFGRLLHPDGKNGSVDAALCISK